MIKRLTILLLAITFVSCSNEPSLQRYFVDNTESSDFIAVDLPSSVINTEKMQLSAKEKNTLDSFDKLNILAFKKDSLNEQKFKTEKEKVKTILKNETYEELMRFGSNKNDAAVYLVGKEDNFDEVVFFASNEKTGFVLARFLGDDMNPNTVLDLIDIVKKTDVDLEALKPLKEMFDAK